MLWTTVDLRNVPPIGLHTYLCCVAPSLCVQVLGRLGQAFAGSELESSLLVVRTSVCLSI
jgi:hypothetical protein